MTDAPGKPSPSPLDLLDLDAASAARREGAGAPLRIRFRDEAFELPTELPLAVLGPLELLDGKLALLPYANDPMALLAELGSSNPRLVADVRTALDRAARVLFGEQSHEVLLTAGTEPDPGDTPLGGGRWRRTTDPGQWPAFLAHGPSVQDLLALGRGLLAAYKVSLGDLFGSTASAADGGPTSSATSSGTTTSTPGGRSRGRAPRVS